MSTYVHMGLVQLFSCSGLPAGWFRHQTNGGKKGYQEADTGTFSVEAGMQLGLGSASLSVP